MNESEFIEESLHLKNQFFGFKTSMDHLRKMFAFCSKELDRKNDAEAKKLFSRYWHQHNHELRVFHNLSENEIYNVIKKRSTVTNALSKLCDMGAKLTELANKLNVWTDKGKIVYDAIRLCQSVQNQSRRSAPQDIRERIREMQQSKNDMIRVFALVRQLASFMAVPFVSSYITMYAAIFVKLGNLCDKIADYALKIAKETEEAFEEFRSAFNSHNSILSQTMKYYLDERRNKHR